MNRISRSRPLTPGCTEQCQRKGRPKSALSNTMPQITDIIATLDELLSPAEFDDLGPNGLQVPGASEVTKVVTGVSARRALHERAAAAGAQLVLVHHGLFWK